MSDRKLYFVREYFAQWHKDISRAETLLESDEYFLEGLLVLVCYIGALARLRYPQEKKDWKSYKTIVWEYGGKKDLYGNIDLLFFYQWPKSKMAKWPKSKMANASPYQRLKNHSEIATIFQQRFGDEAAIKDSPQRYHPREALMSLIKETGLPWFDESNFIEKIELFSNNQILYEILRCEAVHNADFPLFNPTCCAGESKITYEGNHQITGRVILETVKNIHSELAQECNAQSKWPWEISCV